MFETIKWTYTGTDSTEDENDFEVVLSVVFGFTPGEPRTYDDPGCLPEFEFVSATMADGSDIPAEIRDRAASGELADDFESWVSAAWHRGEFRDNDCY